MLKRIIGADIEKKRKVQYAWNPAETHGWNIVRRLDVVKCTGTIAQLSLPHHNRLLSWDAKGISEIYRYKLNKTREVTVCLYCCCWKTIQPVLTTNQLWSAAIFLSLGLSHSDNKVSLNNRVDLDEVNLQIERRTLKARFINGDYHIVRWRG